MISTQPPDIRSRIIEAFSFAFPITASASFQPSWISVNSVWSLRSFNIKETIHPSVSHVNDWRFGGSSSVTLQVDGPNGDCRWNSCPSSALRNHSAWTRLRWPQRSTLASRPCQLVHWWRRFAWYLVMFRSFLHPSFLTHNIEPKGFAFVLNKTFGFNI